MKLILWKWEINFEHNLIDFSCYFNMSMLSALKIKTTCGLQALLQGRGGAAGSRGTAWEAEGAGGSNFVPVFSDAGDLKREVCGTWGLLDSWPNLERVPNQSALCSVKQTWAITWASCGVWIIRININNKINLRITNKNSAVDNLYFTVNLNLKSYKSKRQNENK